VIIVRGGNIFGFEVTIQMKNAEGNIKSAFLKGNTSQHLLNIEAPADIVKIFGLSKEVFIADKRVLDIWSKEFFTDVIKQIGYI